MSSRMRVTKGHSGNRRAHHALGDVRLSDCSNCGEKHERHKLCLACGFYRGRQVLDIKNKEKIVTTADDEVQKRDKNDVKKIETEDVKVVSDVPKVKAMRKVQAKG